MPEENKKKATINEPIVEFIGELKKQFESEAKEKVGESDENAEDTAENVARLYEKVRNLIEYKDDHLIKRNAIERILRRNLLIEFRQKDFTGQFIEELSMSGYLDRTKFEEEKRKKLEKAMEKYRKIVKFAPGYETKKWMVGMASCEIEEILFPNPARFALVRAMYRTVRERIVIKNGAKAKEGEKDIQIFLAAMKSITKPDNTTFNYALLKIYLPEWFREEISEKDVSGIAKKLPALRGSFRRQIGNPVSMKVSVAIRKYAVYFNIFYEAALGNISKIEKILANPETLNFTVQLAADDVYGREMKKFHKRVRRSLIFLVITKIFLAVAVEYPFDRYVIGIVAYVPIAINLLFPPLYLLLLSSTVKCPSEQNSELVAKGVHEIVYEKKTDPIAVINLREAETFSDLVLNLFFALTYGVSFGLAIWILNLLDFNWLGIIIFLFLFSVVSFFNALVRQPIRELLVAREKEGIVGMAIDTLSMPFVRMGKWMSVNFSRVNVIIFLFDVIIEAPFKVMVRFIRQWAGFIRKKREEMI